MSHTIYILKKKEAVCACMCRRFQINTAVGQMFMLMKINGLFTALMPAVWM